MTIERSAEKTNAGGDLRLPPVNNDLVEGTIVELNRICKTATFDFAMNVGALIITKFYDGNLDQWRHRGRKSISFRKLAKHPSLPMSPSALYRSVAIYELCVRLRVDKWKHISTSHIRLVLGVPVTEQADILRIAESEHWSVKQLRDEVATRRGGAIQGQSSEAESATRLRGTIRVLSSCLDETDNLVGAADAIGPLSPDIARGFAVVVCRLREACVRLENRLNKHLVKGRSEPPPPMDAADRSARTAN